MSIMSSPFSSPTVLPDPEDISLPFPPPTAIPEGLSLPFPIPTELPDGMSLPFPLPSDISGGISPPFPLPSGFPEGMSPPFPIPTDSSVPFGPPPGFADGSSALPLPPTAPVPDMISIGVYDAIVWTAVSLAVIATVARLYTRLRISRSFGADDTLILLGQLVTIASAAVARWHVGIIWEIREISLPAGRILLGDTPRSIELINIMFRSSLVSEVIYLTALPLIKCSILAFYRRIAHLRQHYYIIYFLAFLILTNAIIVIFLTIFAIEPVSAMWNMMYAKEMELRWVHSRIQIANSAFQVFFDLVILALPVPVIFKLRLRRKDRAGLLFIYLLSLFSLAATIVRLVFVIRFDQKIYDVSNIAERMDYSYWAMLEITTAIICANLPALPALYRRITGRDKVLPVTASNSKSNIQTSGLSRPYLARRWFDEKWSSLLQHTTRRNSTERSSTDGASSSSKASLTNFDSEKPRNDHVAEISGIGVLPPSKGSFKSSRVSGREKEDRFVGAGGDHVVNVGVGDTYGDSSILALPPINESGSAGRHAGKGSREREKEEMIYRTDEINVTTTSV